MELLREGRKEWSLRFAGSNRITYIEDELKLGASLDTEGVLKVGHFEDYSGGVIESLLQRSLELWMRACREVSQWIQEVCLSSDVGLVVEGYEVLCREVKSLQEEYLVVCFATSEVLLGVQLEDEELREWARTYWGRRSR